LAIVRNLIVRGGADFSGMRRGMQQAQSQLNNFHRSISGTVKKIGLTLATIGASWGIKSSVDDAMKFEALMGTLSTSLGNSMNDFIKWQNTVGASIGFSKLQSAELANMLSLNFKMFATSQKDLLDKTTKMMETAAVISSKRGMAMTEVSDRIRSAMNQEADGADELGVNVRVTAMQQSKAYKEMANGKPWSELSTNMQKAILYHHILESVSTNLGDSLQHNTALKMSAFTATLKDVGLAFGQAFLPILNIALPVLTAFMRRIETALQYVSAFSRALFGVSTGGIKDQAKATQQQASAVGGLGNATEKAGKQAKKAGKDAKGALASFDEINSLANNSSSGADTSGADASAITTPDMGQTDSGIQPINAEIQAYADKVRGYFNVVKDFMKGVGSFISKNKEIIISAIAGIAAGFAAFEIISKWSKIVKALQIAWEALSLAITGISWPIVAVAALIALFVGNLVYLWQTNEKFRDSVLGVWQQIKDFVTKVTSDMWEILKGTWDKYGADIVSGVGGFMKSIQSIILNLWESFLKPVMKSGLEMLSNLWDKHLKGLVAQLLDFVAKLVSSALEIWNKFISPIVNWLIQTLGPIFASVFSGIFKVIGTVVGVAADVASGLFKALGGILDFITGVFTGNWSKAWNGVKDIFGGIFDSLYSLVKTSLNWIIDMVNKVISGLNSLSIKIPDWSPVGAGQSFGINIKPIPHLAKGGITNGPTLAMIGDNPGGQEVVSPLDKLSDIVASAVGTAMMQAMQYSKPSTTGGDILFNIDGRTFGRIIKPFIDMENNRVGNNVKLNPI
jgi:hypothetical protein